VIEALSENAPPELILPMLFAFITPASTNADTRIRWAALQVLSAGVEGCGEYIRMTCLDQVMAMVTTMLGDPMLAVRRTACITLSELGELPPPPLPFLSTPSP
jgi:hypothetical protein